MTVAQFALIAALFVRALAAWGQDSGSMSVDVEARAAVGGITSSASVGLDQDGKCLLLIYPAFWTYGRVLEPSLTLDETMLRLIEHEVGHCLGFAHPIGPGPETVMGLEWWRGVTDYDRLRLRLRQHPPARIVLPMVVHE